MAILTVKDLNYSIKNKVLYTDASFDLNNGEHMGIVGRNGVGKSTLINMINGMVEVDNGLIQWGKNTRVGYLDQHAHIEGEITILNFLKKAFEWMFETEKEIANLYDKMAEEYTDELAEKIDKLQTTLNTNDFYSLEGKIMKVASGLGINAFGIDTKLANLSGGQRAKVILAKLLLESPDVLLMDEPTNFLDKNHVAWLTNYLSNYQGAFIIISHDHDFLNSITNCIIDIEFTKIKKYTGNFQQYLRLKEINTENYVKEYEKQQVTISKLQEYYDKNHARASTAKSAQSKLKQLEKLEIMPPAQTLPPPKFKFTATWIGDQEALRIENLEIGYDRVLLPKINLIMRSKEKIVINGFNGIGKSTFLKTILGIVPKISGEYTWQRNIKIGYFEQDLIWKDPTLTPFQIVGKEFPKWDDKLIRSKLATCGVSGKTAMSPISTLSGGEQCKVKICILSAKECNFLILDEIVNHLDVTSKDVLKEQLKTWEGGILLVSHEDSFYKDWVDQVINIKK